MKIDCNLAVNYLKYEGKMCNTFADAGCDGCPLSETNNGTGKLCVDYREDFPEKAVDAVQKWVDENVKEMTVGEYLDFILPQKHNNHECDCDFILDGCELCPMDCRKDAEYGKFKDLPISEFIPDYRDRLKIHLYNSPTAHIDGVASLLDAFTVRQKHWGEIGIKNDGEK